MTRARALVLTVALTAGATAILSAQGPPASYTPSQADTQNYRNRPCADPWINIAFLYAESRPIVSPGTGRVGACDTTRYNRGSWNSFNELRVNLVAFHAYNKSLGLSEVVINDRGARLQLREWNRVLSSPLIGQDGASLIFDRFSDLIGKGSAGIVAAGGGNIVAAGGGNAQNPAAIVTAGVKYLYPDGTPIVAAGGGNYSLQSLGGNSKQIGPGVFLMIR